MLQWKATSWQKLENMGSPSTDPFKVNWFMTWKKWTPTEGESRTMAPSHVGVHITSSHISHGVCNVFDACLFSSSYNWLDKPWQPLWWPHWMTVQLLCTAQCYQTLASIAHFIPLLGEVPQVSRMPLQMVVPHCCYQCTFDGLRYMMQDPLTGSPHSGITNDTGKTCFFHAECARPVLLSNMLCNHKVFPKKSVGRQLLMDANVSRYFWLMSSVFNGPSMQLEMNKCSR